MLSFLYGPTLTSIRDHWKTIALTRQTFVGKVMSLLFNMLSRLIIDFLPRSKLLLISRLHSPSAVILEPPKIKSITVSIVSPSIFHAKMGQDAMIVVFGSSDKLHSNAQQSMCLLATGLDLRDLFSGAEDNLSSPKVSSFFNIFSCNSCR